MLLAGSTITSFAQAPAEQPTPPDTFVSTHHQLQINGKTLRYTAHAGFLPLNDNDTGELMARMFIIAYSVERSPGQPARPVTFIWNGGPGSNSAQVHLLGYGPKGFNTPSTFPEWNPAAPPAEIVDRPETWLDVSDLVFVDPIGTGYSRAASDKYRDILYTTHGDGEAVAEMIRLYRARFNVWDAPLFLAGESYGTTRAMEVAADLERRRTHLAGVMLVSGFYNLGQKIPSALNTALRVPMFTATAYYHKLLPPELQSLSREEAVKRATEWARSYYAPMIEKRDSLSMEQRLSVLDQLKRYTGIDPHVVNARKLSIDSDDYMDYVMADQGFELGRFDTRMTRSRRSDGTPWTDMSDASLSPMLDLMEGTSVPLIRYLRETLKYKSDLLYRGPFGEAFHPLPLRKGNAEFYDDAMSVSWDHGASERGEAAWEVEQRSDNGAAGGNGSGQLPLRSAMEANPKLLIFVVQGMYDGILGISCASKEEAVARTDPSLRDRVRTGCYAGGHMMYTDVGVRSEMKRDFARFIRDGMAASQGGEPSSR